jgi:chromate transport protein ChrA
MSLGLTEEPKWPDKYGWVYLSIIVFSFFVDGIWPRETQANKIVYGILILLMALVMILRELPRLIKTRDQNISRVVLFLYGIALIMFVIRIFIHSLPLIIAAALIVFIGMLINTPRVRAFLVRRGGTTGDGSPTI